MTDALRATTVYDVLIVNGKPVRTPCVICADPSEHVKPDGIELYPSDELQQESARLNRMFSSGNF